MPFIRNTSFELSPIGMQKIYTCRTPMSDSISPPSEKSLTPAQVAWLFPILFRVTLLPPLCDNVHGRTLRKPNPIWKFYVFFKAKGTHSLQYLYTFHPFTMCKTVTILLDLYFLIIFMNNIWNFWILCCQHQFFFFFYYFFLQVI